jgi:hypothetical protein
MNELTILKNLLTQEYVTEKNLSDSFLELYLELASNSITKWKGSAKYNKDDYGYERVRLAQLNILKAGAEGQISHSENGITRVYSYPDIEMEVLKTIPTIIK